MPAHCDKGDVFMCALGTFLNRQMRRISRQDKAVALAAHAYFVPSTNIYGDTNKGFSSIMSGVRPLPVTLPNRGCCTLTPT